MINSKIEAIALLEESFKHLPDYKKKWTDYIELCVMEVMEEKLGEQKVGKVLTQPILKAISNRIIRLFQADWWENQEED